MAKKEEPAQDYNQQYFADINTRLRDIEEKQRLLKDRILLISQTLIDEKDKTFEDSREIKKAVMNLQHENSQLKSFVKRLSELTEKTARKEELMILQRQFDLFRDR